MSKINLTKQQLKSFFNQHYISTIQDILDCSEILITDNLNYKKDYVDLIVNLFLDDKFIANLLQKINYNEKAIKLYNHLIWSNNIIDTKDANKMFGLELKKIKFAQYTGVSREKLSNSYNLVERVIYNHWRGEKDFLKLDRDIKKILKLFYPKPYDYDILEVKELLQTQYSYSNEDEVLNFINIIDDMLKNNLVEFGKTNEKPLLKSLNILKSSTGINEFYDDKKSNILATDMLTRSFSYYYWKVKKFEDNECETLRNFLRLQFDNQLDFFITRIFASHLKKVRFDFYYSSQNDFFDLIKLIVNNLTSKGWVSVDNILNFCKYRDMNFHLESSDKTYYYNMLGEDDKELTGEDYYYEIVFEPIIKACLFYLGALGIMELKYNTPKTQHSINAKGLSYISVWDGLKYVKLTTLGLYTLRINQTYNAKKIEKKVSNIKFDEYKPIININNEDTIMIAKLEPYVEKYENRYILSYSKIFRDCKNTKALDLKIAGFYKLFDTKLPKVFDDFFSDIKSNSNMIKRDLKLITIVLKNNKKLLHLFMTNKKIKEIIIKASGYRVLVLKDDMLKLTKIVKENGFFIEF